MGNNYAVDTYHWSTAVPGYGGFTAVARMLTKLVDIPGMTVSRQQVASWYGKRSYSEFPEPHQVTLRNGVRAPQFEYAEVAEWYRTHREPGTHGFTHLPHATRRGRPSSSDPRSRPPRDTPGEPPGTPPPPPSS